MKKTIYLLFALSLFISCTSQKQRDNQTEENKLTFDSITLEEKIKLLPDSPDSIPYATAQLHFVYPSSFRSPDDLQRLQSVFYKLVFGDFGGNSSNDIHKDTTPRKVVDKWLKNYADFYRKDVTDYYREQLSEADPTEKIPYYMFAYDTSVENKITFINNSIVNIYVYSSDYYGGAHGTYFMRNTTVNLNSIEIVEEKDIFDSNYREPLAKIIRKKLLEDLKEKIAMDDENELKEYFFNFDSIYPNNNFFMTDKGLIYTYNVYELAPYAVGNFEVEIAYNEIEGLLKPDVLHDFFPNIRLQNETSHDKTSKDDFSAFLSRFLNDCWWNKNFNAMLRDNDKALAKYIDENMDIRRYYNPGTVAYLYSREQNFGFTEYDDFELKNKKNGKVSIKKADAGSFAADEEPIDPATGGVVIYYHPVESVPQEVIDNENLISRPVALPYPDANIRVAYLPNYFKGHFTAPRAFYFIETPSGWKLAFVDDSLFSA